MMIVGGQVAVHCHIARVRPHHREGRVGPRDIWCEPSVADGPVAVHEEAVKDELAIRGIILKVFQARPWVDVIRDRNCYRQSWVSVLCVSPLPTLETHVASASWGAPARASQRRRRGFAWALHRRWAAAPPGASSVLAARLVDWGSIYILDSCSGTAMSLLSALSLAHFLESRSATQVQHVLHGPDSWGGGVRLCRRGEAGIQSHMVWIRHSVSARLGFKSPSREFLSADVGRDGEERGSRFDDL